MSHMLKARRSAHTLEDFLIERVFSVATRSSMPIRSTGVASRSQAPSARESVATGSDEVIRGSILSLAKMRTLVCSLRNGARGGEQWSSSVPMMRVASSLRCRSQSCTCISMVRWILPSR